MIKLGGYQKLTLLDYDKYISAIVFTNGCNMNCQYCQNSELLNTSENYTKEIIEYLDKRKNYLEGVVITGGEPTIHKDLIEFIKIIKSYNLKVKLDTNGSNPKMLEYLIKEKLIDYVAMDIKNDIEKYDITTSSKNNIEDILKSIKILDESNLKHEFRTTIIKELHNLDDITNICKLIKETTPYYLQNFQKSEHVPNQSFTSFNEEELRFIKRELNRKYKNLKIRNMETEN